MSGRTAPKNGTKRATAGKAGVKRNRRALPNYSEAVGKISQSALVSIAKVSGAERCASNVSDVLRDQLVDFLRSVVHRSILFTDNKRTAKTIGAAEIAKAALSLYSKPNASNSMDISMNKMDA